MANDFNTSWFLIVTTYSVKDFVMRKEIVAFNRRFASRIPSFEKLVIVLMSAQSKWNGTSFWLIGTEGCTIFPTEFPFFSNETRRASTSPWRSVFCWFNSLFFAINSDGSPLAYNQLQQYCCHVPLRAFRFPSECYWCLCWLDQVRILLFPVSISRSWVCTSRPLLVIILNLVYDFFTLIPSFLRLFDEIWIPIFICLKE